MSDPETTTESEKTVVPAATPRHLVDMRNDLERISELISSIERLSTNRRKIDPAEFAELRERITRLPLPTE